MRLVYEWYEKVYAVSVDHDDINLDELRDLLRALLQLVSWHIDLVDDVVPPEGWHERQVACERKHED